MPEIDGEAALDSFVEVLEQFCVAVRLSDATRNGWYFGPISAFFRFMDNDFKFHGCLSFRASQYGVQFNRAG